MYAATYTCIQIFMHEIVNFGVVFYIFCVLWQNAIYIFGGFHIGIAAYAGNALGRAVKMCDAEEIKTPRAVK